MRKFAENYPNLLIIKDNNKIVQQPVAQIENMNFINDELGVFLNIPWGHNYQKLVNFASKWTKNYWSSYKISIRIIL
jgi:hypothetical protein